MIRPYRPADESAVVALWETCGLTRPWNDPRADLSRAHERDPDLLLVAVSAHGGENGSKPGIVGTVMAGYDGHRAWIYYLATAPTHRGRGIARALIAEAERRLQRLGSPKVQLMVRAENTGVAGLYEKLGYVRSDVIVLQRVLPGA
ncbi:GNAT family acetyltransferase [Leucobacter sp. CSA2]|uniref:GNAT family acetyltransferase n=1 Tax=Leucobacter edaphi TaxID=2796472 RepID=A0A934UX31_9MICO|nr:GNAT family acetyltransferase [Leucobacter edaphi]